MQSLSWTPSFYVIVFLYSLCQWILNNWYFLLEKQTLLSEANRSETITDVDRVMTANFNWLDVPYVIFSAVEKLRCLLAQLHQLSVFWYFWNFQWLSKLSETCLLLDLLFYLKLYKRYWSCTVRNLKNRFVWEAWTCMALCFLKILMHWYNINPFVEGLYYGVYSACSN